MLNILTGSVCVIFFMTLANAQTFVHVTSPAEFLDGLQTAKSILSFGEPHCEEYDLHELLPWAGNV